MSDGTPRSRDRGVEFGDLGERLADASFPLGKAALLRSAGDHEIGLSDGEVTTLGAVLEPAGVERFASADEVLATVHLMLGWGAVGVPGQTGRGTSHLTPPDSHRPRAPPNGDADAQRL